MVSSLPKTRSKGLLSPSRPPRNLRSIVPLALNLITSFVAKETRKNPPSAAGTTEVGAGTYEVEIRPESEGNDADPAAEFPDQSLESGGIYTAYAAGYLSPDDDPGDEAFDLLVKAN